MEGTNAFIGLFKAQRNLFGLCPLCGEIFRLSDIKISYRRKFPVDWYDELLAEEEKIAERESKLEEKLEGIREKATEHARRVLLPKLLRKVDPLFTSLGYFPQDVKAIFDPIDFVVFDGMNRAEKVKRVVFMDQQTENREQRMIQKSMEKTIEKERYEWETIRISSKTGEIETS
jgi:predicted Holliday junction resolvase-like endonuclease